MNDDAKSKDELLAEVLELRRQLADLKTSQHRIRSRAPDQTESEEGYQSLLKHSVEGIARFEHNPGIPVDLPIEEQVDRICRTAKIADCNDAFARGVGAENAAAIIGKYYIPDIRPARPEIVAVVRKFVVDGHRLVGNETASQLPDGKKLYFLNDTLGVIEDGLLTRSWVIRRDITRIREAQAELRANHENYEALLQHSAEGIALLDHQPSIPIDMPPLEQAKLIYHNSRVLICNDVFAYNSGLGPAEEIIGRAFFREIKSPRERTINTLEKYVRADYRAIDLKAQLIRPDGSVRHLLVNTYGIVEDGHLVRSWGVHRDITKQLEAEAALRKSDLKFREYFNNSGEGIVVHHVTPVGPGRIIEVNDTCKKILGYTREELLAMSPQEFLESEEWAKGPRRVRDFMEKGRLSFEVNLITKNGEKIPVVIFTTLVDVEGDKIAVTTFADLREQKMVEARNAELEERLQRARRLETIGRFAGGIAHDFNNILTPIICNVEDVLEDMDSSDPRYEAFQDIIAGSNRAQELVDQILTFSRRLEPERQSVEVASIIKEALKLLRPVVPPGVKIKTKLDRKCPPIWADPSHIHRIVFNLCTNGFQAMEGKKGTLSLGLKPVSIDAEKAELHPNFETGEYVLLSVSDTGMGMDKNTRYHLFEPYFSTKDVSKGTGLGLSVVYGIVQQNNGEIVVSSEPGQGSTFEIYLPVDVQEDELGPAGSGPIKGGSETILILDDDSSIIHSLSHILGGLGYTVDGKTRSDEALEAVHQNASDVDLVITDLRMPDMSGLELARELQRMRPGLPVILITGYNKSITEEDKQAGGIREVLGKPVTKQTIAAAVRRVLDS